MPYGHAARTEFGVRSSEYALRARYANGVRKFTPQNKAGLLIAEFRMIALGSKLTWTSYSINPFIKLIS